MDAVHLALALGPLAVYLVLLGTLNLGRRPRMMTGAWDAAWLGLALSGFAVIGPMELFLPEPAVVRFGPMVWLLLIAFYGLSVLLWILLAPPRLVIYNQTAGELRPVLEQVAAKLDSSAAWAGDTVALPQLDVQLHLDDYPAMRNVSLVPLGSSQSLTGWRRLRQSLATALNEVEVRPNPRGFSFIACGILMICYPGWLLVVQRHMVAQKLLEMLRL